MEKNPFNSIARIAELEVSQLRSKNPVMRKLRYTGIWAWLIDVSSMPVRHTAGLFLLSLLFALSSYLMSPDLWLPFRDEFTEIKSFHNGLLSVQATLAALTYPIVIGFVGVLLQGRRSAKARMQIYLIDSSALLAGLSSLFLILAMSIQSRFITLLTPNVRELWIWMDLAWFLANGIGTIYFLVRTVNFIRPDRQARVITRYAVCVAWLNQLRLLLKHHHLWSAQQYGHFLVRLKRTRRKMANLKFYCSPYGEIPASQRC